MDECVAESNCAEILEGEVETRLENGESKFDQFDNGDLLPPEPKKNNPLECCICSKIFSCKQALKTHAITHEDPTNRQTFRCEICESTFKSQQGLNYHLETKHTTGFVRKTLPCPTCGRIFKSVEGRKIHMTIQHGAGGPIFKCQECPMVFARKPHLDLHMTTHGSGLHVCTICGKPYARLKDLSRHEATCGLKELCCSICGKQFRKEQALENHEKKCRSSSRNIPCLICGQRFATEQALKTHQAVHQRTFQCGECTQSFGTVLALRNHEQIRHRTLTSHEGGVGEKRGRPKKNDTAEERPKVRMRRSKYDLYIGLEHLADPSTLIEELENEIKTADPSPRRFACDLCPANFASKRSLVNHRQRQHWEALGLQEPIAGSCTRRITRPRKVVNYVDPDELPQEANIDAETEVNVLKLEDTTSEQSASKVVMIANYTDPEGLLEEISDVRNSDNPTNDSIENAVVCRTFYVEENPEPNEKIIKQEIIDFEDYSYDHFENDSACSDEQVDDVPFESGVADSEIPEEQTTEEVDTFAVEPMLEINVPNKPRDSKELVIMLEKLDYSCLAKTPMNPEHQRYKCDHCPKRFFKERHLTKHMKNIHKALDTYIACETCCQLFKTHDSWKRHQEIHNDVKSYCCEHCGKKFKARVNLKMHKRNSHPENVSETALAN